MLLLILAETPVAGPLKSFESIYSILIYNRWQKAHWQTGWAAVSYNLIILGLMSRSLGSRQDEYNFCAVDSCLLLMRRGKREKGEERFEEKPSRVDDRTTCAHCPGQCGTLLVGMGMLRLQKLLLYDQRGGEGSLFSSLCYVVECES